MWNWVPRAHRAVIRPSLRPRCDCKPFGCPCENSARAGFTAKSGCPLGSMRNWESGEPLVLPVAMPWLGSGPIPAHSVRWLSHPHALASAANG